MLFSYPFWLRGDDWRCVHCILLITGDDSAHCGAQSVADPGNVLVFIVIWWVFLRNGEVGREIIRLKLFKVFLSTESVFIVTCKIKTEVVPPFLPLMKSFLSNVHPAL